jgi:predicted amidohydrolase YtcJ
MSCSRALLVFVITLSASPSGAQVQPRTAPPDTILVNGRVFTGSETHPYAEALAIKGTRILAIGTSEEISSKAGPTTRRIDLAGRLVIPGINDSHTHFEADVIGTKLDFGDDPSCAHVLDILQHAVASAPPGTLLSGTIGPSAFFGQACAPATLDKMSLDDPIVLAMDSPHSGMLNQAAARKFGIREDAPPPLAGFFGKDMKSRRWDGVVHESAWFRIRELLMGDLAGEEARLRRVLARAAQWGVTSITLLEVYPSRRVQQLSEIDSPLRIRLGPFLEFQEPDRRKQPEYPPVPAHLADRVSVSGLKYLLDGTPEERSAATRVPYADDPTTSGQIDFTPEELRAILHEAQQRNVQLLLHAIGDRTTETLLNAMEATGGPGAWSKKRLRIEHGEGVMPDLVPRAKALGVIVVENPSNFAFTELSQQRYGKEKASIDGPFRSLLLAGIPLAIATDSSPLTPFANPYLHIMYACAYPGRPKESMTREEAVTAFTRTPAYAEFAEDTKGTLEPGKLADLAVLSQDIFQVPLEDLPKTESVLTMVGGQIAYAGGGFARYQNGASSDLRR